MLHELYHCISSSSFQQMKLPAFAPVFHISEIAGNPGCILARPTHSLIVANLHCKIFALPSADKTDAVWSWYQDQRSFFLRNGKRMLLVHIEDLHPVLMQVHV